MEIIRVQTRRVGGWGSPAMGDWRGVVCRIHPAKRGLCKSAGAGGIDFFNLGQLYFFQGTDQQKRIYRNRR